VNVWRLSLISALIPVALAAQQPAPAAPTTTPILDAVRAQSARFGRNMPAAAEAMPADKYAFKPTPGQMSFGELVLHVANSNNFLCSTAAGMAAPAKTTLTPTSPHDSLVAAIRASFVHCDSALARVDESKLADQVPFYGGRMASRFQALLSLSMDWADHYSQQAMYLRLNGLLPPSARPRP